MSDIEQTAVAEVPAHQDREKRRKFIGGSDIAAVLGISPWKTPVDLWLDKTTPPMPEVDGQPARRVKSRGQRLEPYMLDMIRQEHGVEIMERNTQHRDRHVPYFACEVDARGVRPNAKPFNIELKTVHPFKAKEWGEQETDALPLHYLAQTQWQMGITEEERTEVYALIGDDLRQYIVERDDATIAAMRDKATEFWERFVLTLERPPIDYADPRGFETLKRIYPGTDGSIIQATAAHEHWRAVLADAQEMAKKYQAVADGAQMHILVEMGNAAVLAFPDSKAFTRKVVKVKGRTQEVAPYEFVKFALTTLKE